MTSSLGGGVDIQAVGLHRIQSRKIRFGEKGDIFSLENTAFEVGMVGHLCRNSPKINDLKDLEVRGVAGAGDSHTDVSEMAKGDQEGKKKKVKETPICKDE